MQSAQRSSGKAARFLHETVWKSGGCGSFLISGIYSFLFQKLKKKKKPQCKATLLLLFFFFKRMSRSGSRPGVNVFPMHRSSIYLSQGKVWGVEKTWLLWGWTLLWEVHLLLKTSGTDRVLRVPAEGIQWAEEETRAVPRMKGGWVKERVGRLCTAWVFSTWQGFSPRLTDRCPSLFTSQLKCEDHQSPAFTLTNPHSSPHLLFTAFVHLMTPGAEWVVLVVVLYNRHISSWPSPYMQTHTRHVQTLASDPVA